MALVYKRSDKKTARAYDRSRGMEPNPGVSSLTVVSNPSGRQTSRRTVDRRGTVSRRVSSKLLDNGGSEVAYNIGALRRAMRSNPKGRRVSTRSTKRGVKVRANGKKRRTTRNKAKSRVRRRKTQANRSSKRRTSRKPRRNSRRRTSKSRARKNTGRRSSKRRAPRRNSKRRSSRKPRRNSKRRSSKRRAPRRNSRRSSKRRSSRRRSTRKNARRGTKRRKSSRKSSRRYFGKRRIKATGAEYLDKYLQKGYMPAVAPRYRTGKSRSGIPPVLVYPIAKGQGRLSKRKTSRSTKSRRGPRTRRKATAVGASYRGRRKRRMTANRKRRRSSRRRSRKPRRNSRRRSSKRRSSKRRSSRKPRRNSRRRSSRRRSRGVKKNVLATSKARWGGRGKHRKGRPVGRTFQVLAYGPGSKTRRTSKGKQRKIKGYPVYIPGHVIETAAVRRYRGLGGAAKDSHRRATRRGYRERRKYPRRRVRKNSRRKTSMRKNRRKSRRKSTRRNSRRRSTRRNSRRRSSRRRRTKRNPKYVVAKNRRRRRRRVRRNQGIAGIDVMKDVVTPVIGGTVGFVGARVLSNGLAGIEGVRGVLDKGKPAAEATNTKIAANVLGIVATLGLAPKVDLIRRNQGSLVTGMGLALTDRLLGMVSGDAASYLGEYVTQPLGEYVTQPLGEYVSQPLGAYVDNTLYAAAGMGSSIMEAAAGMGSPVLEAAAGYHEGVDPGDQGGIDRTMDAMEGAMYATAGMGETLYAAAGLGEADASLKAMYQKEQPPFASIHTPTDMARRVSASLPYARPVPNSMVTPEGKGYAGGLFARNLFAGML